VKNFVRNPDIMGPISSPNEPPELNLFFF